MKKLFGTFAIFVIVFAGLYVARLFASSGDFPGGINIQGNHSSSGMSKISVTSKEPGKSSEQNGTNDKEYSNESGEIQNPSDLLVLVNKEYHLDQDFVPKDLVKADVLFRQGVTQEEMKMKKDAASALKKMFSDAKKQGINLCGVSGYRSFMAQESIFNQETMARGIDYAEHYVAYPGQSEHQTGLAMDVGAADGKVQDFGKAKEGIWIKNNAQNYGFILRYPYGKENITGYSYEPWHIRYVGLKAAKEIKSNNMVLEEYLK